jgi:2-aminoethylphosphonate-pyruvate transaminase
LDAPLPKGALTIGECSIIERSIQQLLAQGVERILMGTGHGSDWYDALATRYPITCVPNAAYATTGSMATLRAVVSATGIQAPLVLVESDLIYEQAVLWDLLEHPEPNCVLGMPYRGYGDEVFMQVDDQDHVVGLTKTAPASVETAPVLVGLTTIGPALLQAMVAHYDAAKNPMMDYEDALIAANEPAV